jgi:hypothetical protein
VAVVALVAVAGTATLVGAHGNHVSVNPQVVAGDSVTVESAFVGQDAHIVVHEDDGGEPGAVLGSTFIGDGFHGSTTIDLDTAPDGETDLWFVLHRDDGDGEFDPESDEPLESFGSVAGTQVTVTTGDRPVYVAAPGQTSQDVSDGTLRVDRVAAAEAGHVVVRAIDGGDAGDVVGSTAVEAGVTENVTVELNETYVESQRQYFGVYATLTTADGDGEYDGEAAVTVGDETVHTQIGVRKGGGVSVNTGANVSTGDETGADATTDASADGEANTGSGLLALPGFGAVLAVGVVAALLGAALLRRD